MKLAPPNRVPSLRQMNQEQNVTHTNHRVKFNAILALLGLRWTRPRDAKLEYIRQRWMTLQGVLALMC